MIDDELLRAYRMAEVTEASVLRINLMIRRLVKAGRLSPGVLLGPIVQQQTYSSGNERTDSIQIVQAIIHVPRGIGVVFWDSTDVVECSPLQLKEEARRLFVSFADCDIETRASLAKVLLGLHSLVLNAVN